MKTRMIHTFIVVLAVLALKIPSYATDSTNAEPRLISAVYVSGGFAFSPPHTFPGRFGLHSLLRNNWGAAITYMSFSEEAVNKPADFYATGLFSGEEINPEDFASFSTLWLGRAFNTRLPWLRFMVQAGGSYVLYRQRQFIPFITVGSNYSTPSEVFQTIGLALNCKTDIMPGRYAGLELGVSMNLNSVYQLFTLDCNVLFGVLRAKTEKPVN